MQHDIDADDVTLFNINRQNVLDGAVRALKRKKFNPKARIDVHFSDNLTGIAEDGIDAGGPTREFVRLLMDAIVKSSVFEGAMTARILSRNESGESNISLKVISN